MRIAFTSIVVVVVGCSFEGGGANPPVRDGGVIEDANLNAEPDAEPVETETQVSCNPLARPSSGNIQVVNNSSELQQALDTLSEGDVIELAANTYTMPLTIDVPNVEVRSQSGVRDDVRIEVNAGAAITIVANNVVITAITVESMGEGILVDTFLSDVSSTRIHDVKFIDNERAVSLRGLNQAVDPLISCSEFVVTNRDNPIVCSPLTSGIEAEHTVRLRITRNRFENLSCDLPQQQWTTSIRVGGEAVDTVVDRNLFLHSTVAVLFGEDAAGSGPCDSTTAHLRALACNNIVWDLSGGTNSFGVRYFDSGFLSWAACESSLVHNTVFAVTGEGTSTTEARFSNSSTASANNLSNLPNRSRENGPLVSETNTENATVEMFVEPEQTPPNMRPNAPTAPGTDLSSNARVREFCSVDFNGTPRNWPAPTRGAIEVAN